MMVGYSTFLHRVLVFVVHCVLSGVKDCLDGSDEVKRTASGTSGEILSIPRRFGNHGRVEVAPSVRGALLRNNGELSMVTTGQSSPLPVMEMAFIVLLSIVLLCAILKITKCGRKLWKFVCCLRR